MNVIQISLSFFVQTVFNCLADATCLIIKFDSIFDKSQLKSIWPHYKNAIRIGKQNSHKHSESDPIPREDACGLRNVYCKIDHLISGNLFAVRILSYLQRNFLMTIKTDWMTEFN